MGKGTIDRAADWLRRALHTEMQNNNSAPPAGAAEPHVSDPQLLEYVAGNLTQRAAILRKSLAELDPSASGSTRKAYANCIQQIDELEELAMGVSALAVDAISQVPEQLFDVSDAIRRATKHYNSERAERPAIRIRSERGLPRIVGRNPALPRTLALCFSIAEIVASVDATIIVDLSIQNDFVIAHIFPSTVTSILPPRQRERFHSMMGLAGRLAATFDAKLDLVEREGLFTPRIRFSVS
ncbi:MAG: hypothetical protein ACKVS6_00975 [Planctomycetota bacterium]